MVAAGVVASVDMANTGGEVAGASGRLRVKGPCVVVCAPIRRVFALENFSSHSMVS